MRMGNGFAAVLVVAVGGLFMPGCWFEKEEEKEEPFGRICASPIEGGEFCVPAEEGPAGAWGEALANGSLPIEMWARQPAGMSIDELAKSNQNLTRWFATIDTIIEYVRDEQQSAESYKATMEGKLRVLLQHIKALQQEILSEKPAGAVDSFKAALTEKASAEKDPLIAALANDKQSMGAVQAVFEDAKTELGPLATTYANLVKDFFAYRATETAETEGYKKLAADASKASLDGLDSIEQAVLKAALTASAKPNELIVGAMKLSAQIQQAELAAQEAVKPHTDFMATHGAALPDMTSSALRSLNAMLGYMQRRVTRSDATAMSLIIGIGVRRGALQMLTQGPMVKAKVAQAKLQRASAVFAEASKERVSAFQSAPVVSSKLGLPYLAKRYDELTKLLQMQPLCDPTSSSWREAGCTSLRDSFKGATTYLTTTLSSTIITDLAALKANGVDAALLDAAKTKLDAGDIKAAAVLHDAALRIAEGT